MLVGLGFGLGGLLDGAQLLLLFEFQHHELLEVLGGVRGHALLGHIAHLLNAVLDKRLFSADFPQQFVMGVSKILVKLMVRALI